MNCDDPEAFSEEKVQNSEMLRSDNSLFQTMHAVQAVFPGSESTQAGPKTMHVSRIIRQFRILPGKDSLSTFWTLHNWHYPRRL